MSAYGSMAPPAIMTPSRKSSTVSTDSTSTSTPGGQLTASTDEQNAEEDGEGSANTEKPAVSQRRGSGHGSRDPLETPTKQSRDLLAGLQLQSARAEKEKNFPMVEALKKKIAELEASGWVPDEEEIDGLDDDDYNGVDLDNDQDESYENARLDRERAMFLAGDMAPDQQTALARRLSLQTNDTDDMDLTALEDWDFAPGDAPSIGAFLAREHDAHASGFGSLFSTTAEDSFLEKTETQRRVRFEDEIDGSDRGSVDSDQIAETFPDLFMEADQLGAAIQQATEAEFFLDDGSDTGSCWDFDGDEMQIIVDDSDEEEEGSGNESEGASSGYDSDEGETTDEEAPPHPATLRRIVASRPSSSDSQSENTDAVKTPVSQTRATKRKAGSRRASSPRMPTAGTFILDPRRPVLLVDGAGSTQRNTFYPAKIQTAADKRFWQRMKHLYHNRTSSPRTSVQLTPEDETVLDPMSQQETPNEFFDFFGALRPDQVIGPPEAFMPFTNIDATGDITEDMIGHSNSVDEEEEEDELDAFFDFGEESDEDEEMPDESDAGETPWKKTSSPFPPLSSKATKKASDDLLAHLDRNRGLVGSFRRNQHYAKQIGSMAADPTARASTSEMNAMQAGRRSAGNTPITPLRKKRASKDVGLRLSPMGSPMTKGSNKKKGPSRGGFGGRR